MVKRLPARMICTYCAVKAKVFSCAPSPRTIGERRARPAAVTIRLLNTVRTKPVVRVCPAFFRSSAPRLRAISEEAPEPTMLETATETIITG